LKETRAFLRPLLPLAGVAAVAAAFYAVAPSHPFTSLDLATIAVQTVILAIVASGMTLVIISGGLDLSVGSSVALAGVVVASILNTDALSHATPLTRTLIAFPAAILTGVLCGLYNAALITRLRIPPFIATLGTLGFFRGVAKWISGSSPIHSHWIPHSEAYFCSTCGDIWARIWVKDQPFWVNHAPCARHHPVFAAEATAVPGSLLNSPISTSALALPHWANTLRYFPPALVEREFLLHLNFYLKEQANEQASPAIPA
jgi:ABC-type xylose transport system permease subunit